eukprot:715183-Prymnesium_polylepis.2
MPLWQNEDGYGVPVAGATACYWPSGGTECKRTDDGYGGGNGGGTVHCQFSALPPSSPPPVVLPANWSLVYSDTGTNAATRTVAVCTCAAPGADGPVFQIPVRTDCAYSGGFYGNMVGSHEACAVFCDQYLYLYSISRAVITAPGGVDCKCGNAYECSSILSSPGAFIYKKAVCPAGYNEASNMNCPQRTLVGGSPYSAEDCAGFCAGNCSSFEYSPATDECYTNVCSSSELLAGSYQGNYVLCIRIQSPSPPAPPAPPPSQPPVCGARST